MGSSPKKGVNRHQLDDNLVLISNNGNSNEPSVEMYCSANGKGEGENIDLTGADEDNEMDSGEEDINIDEGVRSKVKELR